MKNDLKFRQIIIRPFDKGWKFILANVLLTFIVIVFFFYQAFSSVEVFIRSFLWGLSICVTQWSGIVFITYKIDQRIPILKHPTKRITLGLLAMVTYSVVAYISIQILMLYLINGTFSLGEIYYIFKGSYVAFLIGASLALIFSANGYLQAWRKAELRGEQLKSEMLSYKYDSLRNQINPHFLFNSFNVLSDLIYEDQNQAVKFVHQMSGLFRYVLDCRDKELVPLEEELEFIKTYIFLLKTRFDQKIEINNQLTAEKDDLIVPMSLQLLIENAVKHNVVSSSTPLKIELTKNQDYIEVKNSLQIKNVGETSKGVGISNIYQQYKFFTDLPVEIKQSDSAFVVRLPLLKSSNE